MPDTYLILVDNSEYSRNGDFGPNRFMQQRDSVNIIITKKSTQNPESTFGILTMAGDTSTVDLAPTDDTMKLLKVLRNIKIKGKIDLVTSLKKARLVLKNRPEKRFHPRIVLFVCSPIVEDKDRREEVLRQVEQLGKIFKKEKIGIDIISFGGETEQNSEILEKLRSAADVTGSCSILETPPVTGLYLPDLVKQSAVIREENTYSTQGRTGFIDDDIDEEMERAIRESMLEYQRQKEREMAKKKEKKKEEEEEQILGEIESGEGNEKADDGEAEIRKRFSSEEEEEEKFEE